jgi:hypothetical protein
MIVSHSRKFIFIKTFKTAGSSLEIALSKYCAPGDILAPLQADEEALRRRLTGRGARNYGKPLLRYRAEELASLLRHGRIAAKFEEHSPGYMVRRMIGPEIWDSYFKFTVVRHPIDRCLSRYFYSKQYEEDAEKIQVWDRASLDQFIRYRTHFINENWRMYTVMDRSILDFHARYETLEDDLAMVSDTLGLEHNIFEDMREIRVKASQRPRGKPDQDVISDRHRDLICALCAKEMDLFGYRADGRTEPRDADDAPRAAAGGSRDGRRESRP